MPSWPLPEQVDVRIVPETRTHEAAYASEQQPHRRAPPTGCARWQANNCHRAHRERATTAPARPTTHPGDRGPQAPRRPATCEPTIERRLRRQRRDGVRYQCSAVSNGQQRAPWRATGGQVAERRVGATARLPTRHRSPAGTPQTNSAAASMAALPVTPRVMCSRITAHAPPRRRLPSGTGA